MRSLTHSSAGTSTSIHHPATPSHATPSLPDPTNIPPSHQGDTPLTGSHPFFSITTDTHPLSPRSRDRVTRALQSGWANTTMRRYSGAVRQFIDFCDKEGVPQHLRLPTDEFVLCAFAASSVEKHGVSTPRNRLAALKAWHVTHNMEWKGSARLRYVLNGVRNLTPGSSKRPPRPPINATMIAQLIEHLDPQSHLDAAVAACATTAFWGQCRLGELLPATTSNPSPIPLPTRSGLKRSQRNPHSCILHLPCTKTNQHGQDVVLVDQRSAVNPITMLKRHLNLNSMPLDAHIFSYRSGDILSSLTKPLFLQRCNDIWQTLGYPRTTGHSFRIGGTTELLLSGIPPDVVKATGRWSSDSFLRYWRSLDDIAPQYIRHIHSAGRRRRHA
jgi:hypothetical protein